MDDEIFLKYIQFSITPGFGPVSQNRLLNICESLERCFELSFEELLARCKSAEKGVRISENRIRSFVDQRNSPSIKGKAQAVLDACHKKNVEIVTLEENRYPARFKTLSGMPVVLYAIGNLKINQYEHSTGIVGARRCSAKGKQRAISCAEEASVQHCAIISGMAKGIDSYAHTAALKNRGYTIAVLGCGPDVCYPAEHKKLYDEIISHGCILSEYPPGTKPRNYMFPERNRLIAALSDKLLVIDAGSRSGTRSTIESCCKYGRNVVRVDPQ